MRYSNRTVMFESMILIEQSLDQTLYFANCYTNSRNNFKYNR